MITRTAHALVLTVRAALILAIVGVMIHMGVVLLLRGGIDSSVPGLVRAYELAQLESVMTPEERSLVESSFSAPNGSGVRTFVGRSNLLSPGSALARAFERAAASEPLTPNQGQASAEAADEANGSGCSELASGDALDTAGVSDSCIVDRLSASTAFVANEYAALGIDLSHVRASFLRSTMSQLVGYLCLLVVLTLLPCHIQRAQVLKQA